MHKQQLTTYEWDMEEVDKDGQILDHDHADNLKDLKIGYSNRQSHEDSWYRLVLVRDYSNGSWQDSDRQWAYVSLGGTLGFHPDYFENSHQNPANKIPQKYLAEFAKHINWARDFWNSW